MGRNRLLVFLLLTFVWGVASAAVEEKGIANAWEKKPKALEALDARLKELESGATDVESAIKQYQAAVANVASIEKELADKRRIYEPASSVVTTLEERLTKAKVARERARQDAVAPLLAKLDALRKQRDEMVREMFRTQPKMKEISEQIASLENMLYGSVGHRASSIKTKVAAVDVENGIVVLNAGTDQGVKKNYEFKVSRGDTFVATVNIIHVEDGFSAGRIGTRANEVLSGDTAQHILDIKTELAGVDKDVKLGDTVQHIPDISTKVAAVDVENGIVVLNAGSEQGVKTNYEFTVFRGDTYVATVNIIHVEERSAAGRIVTAAKDVLLGDKAWTRLP